MVFSRLAGWSAGWAGCVRRAALVDPDAVREVRPRAPEIEEELPLETQLAAFSEVEDDRSVPPPSPEGILLGDEDEDELFVEGDQDEATEGEQGDLAPDGLRLLVA